MRDWLIKRRKLKGLTQEQVARKVGISRSYYSEIETGEKTPSGKTAKRISDVLEFNMVLFFLKIIDAYCVRRVIKIGPKKTE